MKKYLIYIFFLILFFIPKTYALENYNTNFYVNIDEIPNLMTEYVDTNNNLTYFELFENIISLHNSSSFNNPIFITFGYNGSNITQFNVYVKSNYAITFPYTPYALSSTGYNSIHISGFYTSSDDVKIYEFYSSDKPSNILNSSDYLSLVNCIVNNVCSGRNHGSSNTSTIFNSNNNLSNDNDITFNFNQFYRFNNNNQSNYFLYYSSRPITLDNNTEYSTAYYKNLYINNKLINYGSFIPDYRTLYFNNSTKKETSLGNIYIGQIPKNNISNFKFTSTFYYTDYNYVNSLQPRILFFGRVPHTGYYSYEQINCSSDIINSVSINQDIKRATFTLFPNGFSCTSDLSSYDNIYMRVYFLYTNTNSEIIGFTGTSNYGKYYRLSDTQATSINAYIYEYYDSLPNDFSFVLSTLSDEIKAYYITDSSYVGSVHINKDNNKLDSVIYNPISYGTSNNKNVMIYNMSNYYEGLTHLDLFLNYNTIISSIDSTTGTYTYYNSSGVITTDTIINNHTLVYDDSYDTSYYNNIVSGFIDSLSIDINSFSSIIQQAYDLAPPFLQLFIYSVFILFCLYMLYRLIKRW